MRLDKQLGDIVGKYQPIQTIADNPNFKDQLSDVLILADAAEKCPPPFGIILATMLRLIASAMLAVAVLDEYAADMKQPKRRYRRGGGAGPKVVLPQGDPLELFKIPEKQPPLALEGEDFVGATNPNWSDAERIRALERASLHEYLHQDDEPVPAAIREALIIARLLRDQLAATFPEPGQAPQDHLPLDMQKTRDENIDIYDSARKATAVAKESPGYAQAATRDRLLENREQRESDMRDIQNLPQNFQEERAPKQILLDQLEAMQVSKLNQAEQDSPPACPTPAPYTPPIGTEVIDPVEYLRNARENPLSYTPVAFREHARYIPTAAWAAMAAQSAPSATSAPQGGVKVTIERILPPPTHLADEDFRRCMQREIDQIIETFDTGVRG